MAFNIENGSGSTLDINDFGIQLTTGEIVDLAQLADPQTITISAQASNELSTLITSGDVIIKDPLDGVTDLSVADGLEVARSQNDPHWRVGAGSRIGDISDVDLTGEADTVVLQFDSGSGNYVVATPSQLAGDIAINDLTDVDTTGIVTDDILQWTGSSFVAVDPATVGSGASFALEWRFSTSIVAADPGNGRFRYDNATLASVTNIYFDDFADSGFDVGTVFGTLGSGDKIYIQQNNDATKAALFTLSGTPTDNVGWWTIPVTVDASGTLHDNNAKCATIFFQSGAGGGSQNLFETFTPDSGGNIVADTTTDTLTLAGGSAITTTGTPASDTITISVSNNPTFPGIESTTLTIGTTAERPVSPVNGMMRYNTDTNKFEVYENGSWRNMGTGGSGNFELYDENPVSPTPPNASGDNSVAIGDGATASGLDAIAYGAQADASGGDSIAFGMNAVSSNTNSVALGSDTIASGSNSMALGEGATSTATDSYSFGRDVLASAIGSMALLEDADSRLEGGIAQAAGQFSSRGDAQSTVLVSRNSTTDATVTELFQDGSSARLVLSNDTSWAFKILVVARRTDANDESAMYQFLGGIDRNATAATTAIVGNVNKTVIAEDTAQWDCDVDADTTNGSLRIQVTGQAAKTIRWVARVELVEVTG